MLHVSIDVSLPKYLTSRKFIILFDKQCEMHSENIKLDQNYLYLLRKLFNNIDQQKSRQDS